MYFIDVREKSSAGRRVAVAFEEAVRVRPAQSAALSNNEMLFPQPEIKCVDVDHPSYKVAIGSNSSVVKVYDVRSSFQQFEVYVKNNHLTPR